MTKYGIHCCLIDRECRDVGAPARLHLYGPKRNIGIALTRSAMFSNDRLDADRKIVRGKPSVMAIRYHPDENTGINTGA